MDGTHRSAVLREEILAVLPDASIEVDAPEARDGRWFMDVERDGHVVVVEWLGEGELGVSCSAEPGYGEGVEESYGEVAAVARRVIELLRGRLRTVPPRSVLLRELRELCGLTQSEVADAMGVQQAAVSRLERRTETTVGTLRRLIEAMGGELEIVAHFPNRETVRIAQFTADPRDG